MNEKVQRFSKVQRQSVDPYMFYRVPPVTRRDDEDLERQPQCFNVNAETLETARKVIAINLVTVTLLITFMPHNIYNIIVYFYALEPYVRVSETLGALQIPFAIMYPFLICRKLLKKE